MNFFTFIKPKIGKKTRFCLKFLSKEITAGFSAENRQKKPAATSQIAAGPFFEKREKREKRECVS